MDSAIPSPSGVNRFWATHVGDKSISASSQSIMMADQSTCLFRSPLPPIDRLTIMDAIPSQSGVNYLWATDFADKSISASSQSMMMAHQSTCLFQSPLAPMDRQSMMMPDQSTCLFTSPLAPIDRQSVMMTDQSTCLFTSPLGPIDPVAAVPKSRPIRRNVKISDNPQSVAARKRRERISDRIRVLQSLVPGGDKMDNVSLLKVAIQYVKLLKSVVQKLETNGGAPTLACNETGLEVNP